MSLRFDLLHVTPKPDDHPFNPFLQVRVSFYSQDSDNNIIVSPQLMTHREVDECIDSLIQDLNELRSKAKRTLKL